MTLGKLLSYIQKYLGDIEKKDFIINIKIEHKKINKKGIYFLYILLNKYEDLYFITIENLPYCIMPEAREHIIYRKNLRKHYQYDKICRNCDFINNCPGWQKIINNNIERDKIVAPKDVPNEIVMEITTNCNLDCKTCTIDKSKSLNVDYKTAKRIMDECKALNIKTVRFTGGEPFLNPGIEKMLFYAKENNFYVLLNTNAMMINSSVLKLLEKTVNNVLISLQGFNKKSDGILTRLNSDFNKKISNIIKLKTRIPIVRVGTVISRTLIDNIDKYRNLLKMIGVDNWELYRPIVKNSDEEFKVTKKDLVKVMMFLYGLKKIGMKVKIANPVPFCISKNMDLSLSTLLGAGADDGHSRIIWDANGYFKPSYFINKNLGTTIKASWNNSFLKKIKLLTYLHLRCKKCMYLQWCKGGSRAVAKLIRNDYFSADPLAQ